jgi:hypothetical protein
VLNLCVICLVIFSKFKLVDYNSSIDKMGDVKRSMARKIIKNIGYIRWNIYEWVVQCCKEECG